jgi:hypothetical protein
VLANTLVPVVSTIHLVVQRLIGTTPSPYVGRRKNPMNQVRVAQWHAQLELLFAAPAGWAQYPHNLFSGAQYNLLYVLRWRPTKPSRRWQPPRVARTTGLQHEYLVPLDVISQCNALESLIGFLFAILQAQVSWRVLTLLNVTRVRLSSPTWHQECGCIILMSFN